MKKDVNFQAYDEARENSNWLERHLGEYVGFVDGIMVVSGSRDYVLTELYRRYPNDEKFFTLVEKEEEKPVHIPSFRTVG